MDWDRETAILRRAAEQGLIRSAGDFDLERLLREPSAAGAGPWGSRIDRLIRQGRLDERVVEALVAELEHQPTRKFFGGPPPAPSAPAEPPLKAASARQGWPVEAWDRFEYVSFLGEGGMGRVFKAWDRRLGRYVAVKFLRAAETEDSERFLQEARSQARVDHEHVCRVYEAGEVQGRRFIVMQYLAGETLEKAGRRMTPEERVRVMQQVAEGVHAAHRLGLIHRDIKPVNVMVERTEDGQWRPYVLDFGLAREVEAPGGFTRTGFIVGTPAYLAPEQARGSQKLDRRTDVHALGATLYALFAGKPPYEGATTLEILQQVLGQDPVPLRKIDPTVPRDLETIAMKCLEKDPDRRYDSARELAQDLGRYLDGEPIQARTPTLTYRLAKRARKHKAAVAAAAVALSAVLTFGAFAVYTELRSREQTRLASLFGEEARYVEEALRRAYTAPLHDVRPERQAAHAHLKTIEREMAEAGGAGEGPGHHALGRALLALDRPRQAEQHLRRAWEGGYRAPEVAYALGLALGEVYRLELAEGERAGSGADRKRELEKRYRDPALGYLRASRGARVDSPEYVQALIAFYEKRYPDALEKARAAQRKVSWLYEAALLEGEILSTVAKQTRDRGDFDSAGAAYYQADAAYRRAAEIGRSDPKAHEKLAALWVSILETLYRRDQGPGPSLERIEAASRAALVADPGFADAYRRRSNGYKIWAQHLMRRGEDAVPALRRACEDARRAVRLNPRQPEAYADYGLAHLQRARYESRLGLDPRRSLDAALRGFQAALALHPNLARVHQDLGNAYIERAAAERTYGADPEPSFDRGALHLTRAAELAPDTAFPRFNLGNLYLDRARYEIQQGRDPATSFARAITAYEEALQHNANHFDGEQNLGNAYAALARYRMEHGVDPGEALPRAVACYQRALAGKPRSPEPHRNLGRLFTDAARREAALGGDPRQPFRRSLQAYAQALAARPRDTDTLTRLARVHADMALYESEQGRDPGGPLAEAEVAAGRAREMAPADPGSWSGAAAVELAKARCAILRGRTPEPHFGRAAQAARRALEIHPGFFPAWHTLADLHRRRAEWRLARGLSAGDEVRQGLAIVDKFLGAFPRSAEALALKGVLHLLAARAEPKLADRSAAAGSARDALRQALRINRNLQREYGTYLEQAAAFLVPVSFLAALF